jgi:predicted O-methyltransferase YrrM
VRAERRALADRLYTESHAFDERQADRLARWRNVEPETAELLGVLVRALGARRILEIGTSNGYSAIWLGDAAEATGGTVLTLEIDPGRTSLATEQVRAAGLADSVEARTADAADALPSLPDGEFDLVFLDAERPAYVGYWPELVRELAKPGLLAVDNVLSHSSQVADFRALVDADARVVSSLVPIGAGVLLITPTVVERPTSRGILVR